jgi:hypothetical protein
MVRALTLLAFTGFLLAAVCISAAVAIGREEWIAAGWSWRPFTDHAARTHGEERYDWRDGGRGGGFGPETIRDFAWSGGDRLDLDVPAVVQFTQSDGPAKLTVSGPQSTLDRLEVEGGRIRVDGSKRRLGHLTVTLSAPKVTQFEISDYGDLTIENYKQDKLEIDISGAGDVKARGEAKSVDLEISGAGKVDLSDLTADAADVEISGFGKATLAPKQSADLKISGAGELRLLSQPPDLKTSISGAGKIIRAEP